MYEKINLSTDTNIDSIFKKLNKVYKDIPATKGCMENINKDGGCNGWCCNFQNPQVLYSEFLNTWKYILNNWEMDEVIKVIERAVRSYLSGKVLNKGCIFFDKEKKLCSIHSTRPYNCRVYGVVPDEEFNKSLARVREDFKDDLSFVLIREQCDLVETTNHEEVTTKKTDKWWARLNKIEEEMGVPKENINDDLEGSYRTFHDHLLLYIANDKLLMDLTDVRLHGEPYEKEIVANTVVNILKKAFGGQ